MDWTAQRALIAILRGITPDDVAEHVRALIECGFGLIEIPCNSPQWVQSVRLAIAAAGGRAIIGAGTVVTSADVDLLASTGARLMVTPNTDAALIRHAVARGLTCASGFATASEGFAAIGAGAQALKLFPAAQFGPAYVRALKAVLPPSVPLFAVGGITPGNLGDYLQAGCIGAGLGGDLYRPGQTPAATRARAGDFIDSYESHAS